MKRPTPTARFVIVFSAVLFLLVVLFDLMLLRAARQDEVLRPLLSDWNRGPEFFYLLTQLLVMPVVCIGAALWWYFKAPPSGYAKPSWLTRRVIVIFVTVIFAWNLIFVRFLNHPINDVFQRTAYFHFFLVSKSVLHSPIGLLAYLFFTVFALWWVFKPRSTPVSELERLAVFAMTLGGIVGFVLSFFSEP